MQRYCYYSTFKEMIDDGIEGKTFLEVGCGQCPIGQQLAAKGAKKIYGLDISSEMIEAARKELDKKGILDKFELMVEDIFDENFKLAEKVDCVVMSYTLTTFINSYEMLHTILARCSKHVKPNTGIVFIADFQYVNMPKDNFWAGMYTQQIEGRPPNAFEPFDFRIVTAPDHMFQIFNIPRETMIQAGLQAGFNSLELKPQYPDPEVENDPVVRRYLDTCNPQDYLLKFRIKDL